MARFGGTLEDFPDMDFSVGFDRTLKAQESALEDLRNRSNALPDGEIVGALLYWQVADGYAYYVVTSDKPLTLKQVPFLDNYAVDPALIRGLRKQDVLDKIARSRNLDRLFGRRS